MYVGVYGIHLMYILVYSGTALLFVGFFCF
jgi:hypothetical protein